MPQLELAIWGTQILCLTLYIGIGFYGFEAAFGAFFLVHKFVKKSELFQSLFTAVSHTIGGRLTGLFVGDVVYPVTTNVNSGRGIVAVATPRVINSWLFAGYEILTVGVLLELRARLLGMGDQPNQTLAKGCSLQ